MLLNKALLLPGVVVNIARRQSHKPTSPPAVVPVSQPLVGLGITTDQSARFTSFEKKFEGISQAIAGKKRVILSQMDERTWLADLASGTSGALLLGAGSCTVQGKQSAANQRTHLMLLFCCYKKASALCAGPI